jgi:hypothetical protein
MRKIEINSEVKELSHKLSVDSFQNVVHYFPIDRFFIEENGYLEKILSVNYLEFLFCNLENVNTTYTVQLFVCLPELWEKVTRQDIIVLIESFTNSFSFYSFISYTYKYLKIDLLDEIFYNKNVNIKFKKDCIHYFPNIIATFYLDEDDYFEFEENLFGISIERLNVLQEKFKNNNEFKKAISKKELHEKLFMYQI